MAFAARLYNSALLIAYSVFPTFRRHRIWKSRTEYLESSCPAGYIPVLPEDFHNYVTALGCPGDLKNTVSVFIPHVFPMTAPFLLGHLKKTGFSACRVKVNEGGLAVNGVR
jgi:hypothetical protein